MAFKTVRKTVCGPPRLIGDSARAVSTTRVCYSRRSAPSSERVLLQSSHTPVTPVIRFDKFTMPTPNPASQSSAAQAAPTKTAPTLTPILLAPAALLALALALAAPELELAPLAEEPVAAPAVWMPPLPATTAEAVAAAPLAVATAEVREAAALMPAFWAIMAGVKVPFIPLRLGLRAWGSASGREEGGRGLT